MPDAYLPPCCTPPSHTWLLPQPLPGVHLAACTFDPLRWQAEHFEHAGLPAARGLAKRQSEFLAGRIVAREALAALCGRRSYPTVGSDGAPEWPAGVVGSITHGQGHALAVVAARQQLRGVGLDIEALLAPARATRLAEQIHTPAELQRLQALHDDAQAWLTTLTFSLKESLFKALYPLVQRRFYFQDAQLLEWHRCGHACLRLEIDLHPDWPAGSLLHGQFTEFDGRLLSLVAIDA